MWDSRSFVCGLLALKHGYKCAVQSLFECLTEVKCLLANHFLQLNEDKTEIVLFGNKGCAEGVYDFLEIFHGGLACETVVYFLL